MTEKDIITGFIAYIGRKINIKDMEKLIYSVMLYKSKQEECHLNINHLMSNDKRIVFCTFEGNQNKKNNFYMLNNLSSDSKQIFYVLNDKENVIKMVADKYRDDYDLKEDSGIVHHLIDDYYESTFAILANKGFEGTYIAFDAEKSQWVGINIGSKDLFYGFTKVNNQIMFSDCRDLLEIVCSEVFRVPDNCTYLYDTFYTYPNFENKKRKRKFRNGK